MGRPLYMKLGIKSGMPIAVLNAPTAYLSFFHEFPDMVQMQYDLGDEKLPFIHIFAQTIEELKHHFEQGKTALTVDGMMWVSWPKKASNMQSEIDQGIVMKHGLSQGLVDVKVVSISPVWSGLKFVYRTKDRKAMRL